jgi:phosphatidylinositol alpha 1,6-mannosyltransferase
VDGIERRHRVLISAESFLPDINGVTNSVLRVLDHLDTRGHEALVIAPGPGDDEVRLAAGRRVPVERVRGLDVPRYPALRFGVTGANRIRRVIERFRPDVVHLAAPAVLGARVGQVTAGLGLPTVALYQTDLSGFAADYGLRVASATIWSWLRAVHNRADLTLAPTPAVAEGLRHRGFARVAVWGRGVDKDQFDPARRSPLLRHGWGVGRGGVAVGYVGRLAAEKRVEQLAPLQDLPGVTVVIVGDGPERARLERLMPRAHFAGFLTGDELGAAMASLDVMVHAGVHDTFCQTIQEAMAAGVAVVAAAAGGPRDLIDNGRTGLLYPPTDRRAVVRAVELLVADPSLRRRCAAAGRLAVADRTWAAVGDELLGHYRAVIARRALAA